MGEQHITDIVLNVLNLANALSIATENRFLSIEHAGAIFKHFIAQTGIDAPKDKSITKSKI